MPYGGNPAGSSVDKLKFLVGDKSTSASGELLSTGECAWLISEYGSVESAAPYAADAIAADFADLVSKSVGDLRIEANQKFEHYAALAKTMRRSVALRGVVPYAGGISRSDKAANDQDVDRVVPAFTVGQFDNPLGPST